MSDLYLKYIPIILLPICLTWACSDVDQTVDNAQSHHAILNGTPDTSIAHQAVVGLYQAKYTRTCGEKMVFCTGTLIHPQYVLTAAHCVADYNDSSNTTFPSPCNQYMKIGFGNTEAEISTNLYEIADIQYHDGYGHQTLDDQYTTVVYDLAIIKLNTPIPESIAKPILPLPPWLAINRDNLKNDFEFVGFGYDENGKTGNKLTYTGPVTDYCGPYNIDDLPEGCRKGFVNLHGCHPNPKDCEKYGSYDGKKDYILMPYGSLYNPQLNGGTCNGDSGSPVFYTTNGQQYLAGISSYGDTPCRVYGVSTSVQDYYDWIVERIPELADQYVEICDNDVDDDNNGLKDCDDPQCASQDSCQSQPEEICDNDLDDDNNDLKDCDDPQCASQDSCRARLSTEIKPASSASSLSDMTSNKSGSKCSALPLQDTSPSRPLGIFVLFGILACIYLTRQRNTQTSAR